MDTGFVSRIHLYPPLKDLKTQVYQGFVDFYLLVDTWIQGVIKRVSNGEKRHKTPVFPRYLRKSCAFRSRSQLHKTDV